MIKTLIAFIFLTAFAMQTFTKAFIVFDYVANTKNYAKNCVNKAKPKMHCNGKCQMMKKIQEEEKKEQQNQERKDEAKNQVLSTKSFFASLTPIQSTTLSIEYSFLSNGKEIKMPRTHFHPPGA
jgi:hypothetical protein